MQEVMHRNGSTFRSVKPSARILFVLAAELPRFRYHDRRHTYASTLLKAGVEITGVSKLLGHSSIIITLDVYVHF